MATRNQKIQNGI